MKTAMNLVPTIEQSAFDDPIVSPVAAVLVTARAVQAHAERIGAVFYNREVVAETLRYVADLVRYAVVTSMPSMGSSSAIEEQLRARRFDRYSKDQASAEKAKLQESLAHAQLAEALTMPALGAGPLAVATTALAIDTFVSASADEERRIAAIEATDVMLQYMPQVWDAATGHPEMPAVILGQVAAQQNLLE